jgi:hypothetical protein
MVDCRVVRRPHVGLGYIYTYGWVIGELVKWRPDGAIMGKWRTID